MRCHSSFVVLIVASFFVLGCGQPVTQTGTVEVQWDKNNKADFVAAQTFSVVTSDIVPPDALPDLDPEQVAFNDMVNDIIVEAMQATPVCLKFIRPEDVTAENQPDLWAANGLSRTTEGGYYYECVGGWWWGYWGLGLLRLLASDLRRVGRGQPARSGWSATRGWRHATADLCRPRAVGPRYGRRHQNQSSRSRAGDLCTVAGPAFLPVELAVLRSSAVG
jgi:hypothetical protein